MPLWQIYHQRGTFQTASEKSALAAAITTLYTTLGLPAFYVVVQFHQLDVEDLFIGGALATDQEPFVRIVITHIAIRLPDADEAYLRTTVGINEVLKTHVLDKGYGVEYHVDETERRLWRINGMVPPQWRSEEEKVWVRESRAVEYPGAFPEGEGGL
ncbi:tautomerase family protein [Aspergillus homomorphus CBS 101889]|uniref:Tautomerase cis-CaaD-like domain-containing protein n=1 Tax=Aspergillus homomorphus (strain CBS 101889) TaxID=1450537 RepID=A0A395HW75_ASPHC|nr:hypothetical protein BO97DRAFT_405857 [Aspergillus homomorphus CBS 101889]RAL11776.1 hypothetical protein BO97DRAFT_405857 [Aspergillus homomorphus CBS 101889]